jgi:hypothetical protein
MIVRSYPIQRELLKLYNNEKFFHATKPDFIELGSIIDFDVVSGFERLLRYLSNYDWSSTKEVTNEKTFRSCVRIQPAMPEVFGEITKDRTAPYCDNGFNYDEELISSCRQIVHGVSSYFTETLGDPWVCTSIQLPGLLPGKFIDPHVDGYLAYQWSEKIHLPMISNYSSRNIAFSNDAREMRAYHLEIGKFYIINNLIPHSAFNFGELPRVHLIFDVFNRAKHTELRSNSSTPIYSTPLDYADADRESFFEQLAKNRSNLEQDYRDLL